MNIFVAGHRGMVGQALVSSLKSSQNCQIITASHDELNLIDQAAVMKFFQKNISLSQVLFFYRLLILDLCHN